MGEANIKRADYRVIAKNAKNIRTKGQTLNINITNMYSELNTTLKNSWNGKRYNELVKVFNSIRPTINNILTAVIDEIPYNLQIAANNYSNVDAGYSITSAKHEQIRKINDLEKSDEKNGIMLLSAQVRASEKKVSRNIEDANSKIDEIVGIFDSTPWESKAASDFKELLHKESKNIKKAFNDIQSIISTRMTKAAAAADEAERKTSVKKS